MAHSNLPVFSTPGPWKVSQSGYANAPFVVFAGDRAPNYTSNFPLSGVNAIAEIFHDESPAHEEQAANARLIATAPEMFVALAKLVCPECDHELQHHADKYGCEVERGDREGYEGEPAQAMGPCGCSTDDLSDYPDFVRAIEAFRKAKGVSRA
jgi:hypothetical protein